MSESYATGYLNQRRHSRGKTPLGFPRFCARDEREGEKVPSAAAARLGHFPRAPALILHVYSLHCAALLLAMAQELVIREI